MNRWKSEENLQESAVFFLYVASGYVTQVTSLGSKHYYALIHIIGVGEIVLDYLSRPSLATWVLIKKKNQEKHTERRCENENTLG